MFSGEELLQKIRIIKASESQKTPKSFEGVDGYLYSLSLRKSIFFKFFRPKNSKNFIHYNIDATERMTKVANNRKNEAVPRVRDP
jgi:hypothetical protein